MKYTTLKALLEASCDAIRSQDGTEALIDHQDIPDRIRAIKSYGGEAEGTEELAGANDIRKGKKAEVNGEEVVGNLPFIDSSAAVFYNDEIRVIFGNNIFRFAAVNANELIYPAGLEILLDVDRRRFGDAEEENVDYGVTFTSKEGLALTGKRPVDEGNNVVVNGTAEAEALSMLHYWEKSVSEDTITEEKVEEYELSYSNSSLNISYFGFTHYAAEIAVVDGELALVDPIARGTIDSATLNGKYLKNGSDFYRVPADATIERYSSTGASASLRYVANRVFKLTLAAVGSSSVVVADDRTLFPENGEQDGSRYVYKGTLADPTVLEALQVNANGTYTAPAGVGYSPVTVSIASDADPTVLEALSVTENGTYTAPAGVGYSPVTVNVASDADPTVLKALSVTENGTYTAPAGVGYSPVTVNVASEEQAVPEISVSTSGKITATAGNKTAELQLTTQGIKEVTPGTKTLMAVPRDVYTTGPVTVAGDANLVAGNIKSGVSIFGVTGTLATISNDIEAEDLSGVHYWKKTSGNAGTVKETYKTIEVMLGLVGDTVQYADEVIVTNGSIALVNPQTYTLTSDDDAADEVLLGKCVYALNTYYYRIPASTNIIYYVGNTYIGSRLQVSKVYELSVAEGSGSQTSAVVLSTNRSAYPDSGELDGYTYAYQGTLGG